MFNIYIFLNFFEQKYGKTKTTTSSIFINVIWFEFPVLDYHPFVPLRLK